MDGGPGLFQRAAEGTVTDSSADADGLPFLAQFDALWQGVQQHVHTVGVPHPIKRVARPQGFDTAGSCYQLGEFGHRFRPHSVC
ncbi:hypothetical protein D9M69_571540 [compost metagenome]